MSKPAKLYVAATIVAGLVTIGAGLVPWHSDDITRFLCYFLIASLASGFKLHLPGITGTMSVNFCFNLICVTALSLPETLIIACTGTLLQCVWRARTRPQPIKLLFNVASIAITVSATAHDRAASSASATATTTLTVDPVAETPNLNVPTIVLNGDVDQPISLGISAALTEVDDPDSLLSILIDKVPPGVSLNHGAIAFTDPDTGFTA